MKVRFLGRELTIRDGFGSVGVISLAERREGQGHVAVWINRLYGSAGWPEVSMTKIEWLMLALLVALLAGGFYFFSSVR